jgi:hypothetical protein
LLLNQRSKLYVYVPAKAKEREAMGQVRERSLVQSNSQQIKDQGFQQAMSASQWVSAKKSGIQQV